MSDLIGQQIGSYRLIQLLGEGAFGSVYLGEHIHLKSLAALKIQRISLNESDREQFLQEARTLVRLNHAHIVRVLDFTVEQGTPVLIMEHARGGTLRQLCPLGSRLPIATVVAFIRQVADALQYAHNNGVIHRDVKPDNILLNASQQLLLSDFGLAVFAPSREALSTQEMAGTLPYMAPEQFRQQVLFASDQYALAVVAYEWLCGRRPFEGNLWEIVEQHISASPPSLRTLCPEIPAAVEAVVLRALSNNPLDRFASVQSFAWALQRTYLSSQPEVIDPSQITASFKAIYRPPIVRSVDNQPSPVTIGGNVRRSSRPSNRQRLLDKVHSFWIKGVLEKSLHGAMLLELGLQEQANAVTNPWGLVFQSPSASGLPLPPGTRIIQAYDEANGELLILGEPGAGKTTLLLELARDLLTRAQSDELHPMPVIFNLSSWATKRLPLADWLVEELNVRYQVPREPGQAWIADNQILPLLDGLDEVAATYRAECIEAINAYQQKNDPESLVVCCRNSDYHAQPTRLFLQNAVVLQPLTTTQIDQYLLSAGDKLTALREALHRDPDLLKLATNPLFLNVLSLAYYETPGEVITEKNSSMTWQQRVFTTYVERMLQRRNADAPYPTPQIMRWLTWLARQMTRHDQTELYLERLQPDWLPGGATRRLYNVTVKLSVGLICGLICILPASFGLGTLLVPNSFFSLPLGLYAGLLLGLLFALIGRTNTDIIPAEIVNWSWPVLRRRLAKVHWRNVLFGGLLCALSAMLLLLFSAGFIIHDTVLVLSALSGLLGMLLFGLVSDVVEDEVSPGVENARPIVGYHPRRWHDIRDRLPAVIPFGLLCGLVFGLVLGQNMGPLNGLYAGLLFGAGNGLLFAVIGGGKTTNNFAGIVGSLRELLLQAGMKATLRSVLCIGSGIWLLAYTFGWFGPISSLFLGLLSALIILASIGFSSDRLEKRALVRPNQGIWRSARNSVSFGLFFGISAGLLIALTLTLIQVQNIPQISAMLLLLLSITLLASMIIGTAVGLANGGIACIQHIVLRLFLSCSGKIPWNYPRFLDHAADRILLRKVGGGYIFIHRLLLEHFAGVNAPAQPKVIEQEKTARLYDKQSQMPLFEIATIPLREYHDRSSDLSDQ